MARSYTYHGVNVSRKLNADEQRSLAMRLRNFGVKYNVSIAETLAAVEVTSPPKLTVVPTVKPKTVKAPAKTDRQARIDTLLGELGLTPEQAAMLIESAAPKKAKSTSFYDEVIVGKRDERIEKRPYKCPVTSCYKFEHRFSDAGWNGSDKAQGHVDIAHKGDATVTRKAIAFGK